MLQRGSAAAAAEASRNGAAASATATAAYNIRRYPEAASNYFSAARYHYQSAMEWARLENFPESNAAAGAAAAASDGAETAAAAGGGAGEPETNTWPLCVYYVASK